MTEGLPTDERPSPELARVVLDRFGVSIADDAECWEGEESIGWRGSSPEGDWFVQQLPSWRDVQRIVWCNSVALAASTHAPECVHAVPSPDGSTVVVTPEGPVMVFPFVEGTHDRYPGIENDAAALLGRIHRGIATSWRSAGAIPIHHPRPTPLGRTDLLIDHELDVWQRSASSTALLPIHGDYYGGNLLTRSERIVGVVDWGDASVDPFEREVAWAVWEFCQDDDATLVVDDAEAFLQRYVGAGGPAGVAQPFDPLPWIRVRLREEVRTWFADPRSATMTDDYHEAQLLAFERLRGRHLPGR